MLRRSVSRSGPVGFQPSCWRVSALEAARSIVARCAIQPKYSGASSGVIDSTGIFNPAPITSAMSRRATPSSPTAL